MSQLLIPIAVVVLASLGLFLLGRRLGRRLSTNVAAAVCLVPVAVLLVHGIYLADNIAVTGFIPLADAIVYANPQLPAAAFLAGLAFRSLRSPVWQRLLLCCTVLALGLWRAFGPLLGSVPVTTRTWFGDVCKQSTLSTCSAAAAATALRSVGITATEPELASLCLTREAGTTTLGIYRGLKLKTDHTPYRVEPFTGTLDALLRLPPAPTVISVGVTTRGDGHSAVASLLPGAAHSIVILGKAPDGRIDIADPYTGRHQYQTVQALNDSWTGEALRIVPKD